MIKILSYSLYLIGILCFISSKESYSTIENEKKPTLILHIGPHKTGSTHIQSSLMHLSDQIEEAGWYLHKDKNIKWAGGITTAIKRHTISLIPYKTIIDSLYQQQKNTIISSEDFSALMSINEIEEVYNLIKDFNIKIVIIYRELIQRIFSHYMFMAQHPVFDDNGADLSGYNIFPNFYSFLFKTLHTHGGKTDLNFKRIINLWGKVFNIENIYIIDYYGVMDTMNKDIIDVLLCDIGQILCHKNSSLLLTNNHQNPINSQDDNIGSSNVLIRQIVDILHSFAYFNGKNFNIYKPQEIYDHVEKIFKNIHIPSKTTTFEELSSLIEQTYMQMIPLDVHERILYKNITANIWRMMKLSYEELDINTFYQNHEMIQLLNNEYKELERLNYIV